jgi:hypothetical protein
MIESIVKKILLNCLISDQIEVIKGSVNRRDLLTEGGCRAIKLIFMYYSTFRAVLRELTP